MDRLFNARVAVSVEKALRLALEGQKQRVAHVTALNRRLCAEFAKYPKVRFNSPGNAVPHILNLSVNGVKGTAFQQELGKYDVCVSVKSACSAERTPSKVRSKPRPEKRALLVAYQPQSSDRPRENHRISANFRSLL